MRGRAHGRCGSVGRFRLIALGVVMLTALGASRAPAQQFLDLDEFRRQFDGIFGPVDESVVGYFTLVQAFTFARILGIPEIPFEGFNDFIDEARASVDGVPVPSGSTSVAYLWDEKLETFVRSTRPLAPAISQNARTNGRHVLTVGASYSYIDYERFNDNDTRKNVFSTSVFDVLFQNGQVGRGRDILLYETDLKERIYSFSVQFGLLENLDVGVFVPIVDVRFRSRAVDRLFLEDPNTGELVPSNVFVFPGVVLIEEDRTVPRFKRIQDLDRSAFAGIQGIRHEVNEVGIGDIIVRTKYYFGSVGPAEFGGLFGVSVPTGDEDNLLGVGSVRFDPRVLVTVPGDRLSVHANAGYHADVDEHDRDRVDYSVGGEFKVMSCMSVLLDQVSRLEIAGPTQTRKFEIVPGVKVNPYKAVVIGLNAVVPLNREGLTTRFAPNAVVDASFVF